MLTKKEKNLNSRKRPVQIDLLLMVLPGFLIVLIFNYFPIYGMLIAFQDYKPVDGFFGSEWVGLKHFIRFFKNPMASRTFTNTVILCFENLIITTVAVITFALLLNEMRNRRFKGTVQAISSFSNFISTVVIVGLLKNFCMSDGLFNQIIVYFGGEPIRFFSKPEWFRFLYILSGLWQGLGWGAIIYLSSISTIDMALYEAAEIDGANRFAKIRYVTLPGIMPTIMTLFLYNLANIFAFADPQKILLMYNPQTYKTADIIGTLVYREGIVSQNYSYSTAVNMIQIVIACVCLIVGNTISKKKTGTTLW